MSTENQPTPPVNPNPEVSAPAPQEQEKWEILDSGGIGVRDVWCGKQIICLEVSPGIAKAFKDAHDASIDRLSAPAKQSLGERGGQP